MHAYKYKLEIRQKKVKKKGLFVRSKITHLKYNQTVTLFSGTLRNSYEICKTKFPSLCVANISKIQGTWLSGCVKKQLYDV